MARTATARAATAPARRAPVRRAAPDGRARSAAAPRRPAPSERRRSPIAAAGPSLAERTRAAARARAAGALDGVLHGPGLIAIVFVLLVGVVFANVALLQKNRQITRDAARVSELKRENSTLRGEVAALGSSERIQEVAAERGLVLPTPDAVRYLRSNPRVDAVAAAKAVDQSVALAAAVPVTPTVGYGEPDPYVADPYVADPYAADPYASNTELAAASDSVAGTTAGVP